MVYQSNLVAVVKVNGKILRENQSTVAVPFGSEYSIYLKNLNTVRALVTITIDGKDVTAGGLVLNPKQHLDFERSLSNNNLNHGNKFKFIERTSAVEEHRGIGAEDGLIRVEYKFERPQSNVWLYGNGYTYVPNNGSISGINSLGGISGQVDSYNLNTSLNGEATCQSTMSVTTSHPASAPRMSFRPEKKSPFPSRPSFGASSLRSAKLTKSAGPSASMRAQNMNMTETSFRGATKADFYSYEFPVDEVNEAGITVNGSESKQSFIEVASFPTESTTHVIVLKLKGAVEGKKVVQAITVQHKPSCESCGKVNKATANFCTRCGTGLQVFV